jgi:aspartate racemase
MKTIGLVGGMTWHSTADYYRLINSGIQRKLGGSHSADCILCSVDFAPVERLQQEGRWDALSHFMVEAAKRVELAGADFLLICANTMHTTAPAVEAAISIPLLHIADATASEIRDQGLQTVGLLGTRFTMEMEFYRDRLEKKHGLKVLIPSPDAREKVHDVIFRELAHGIISPSSRDSYLSIIGELRSRGAEGVILGCTEIPMLIQAGDCPIPVFDTTAIHAAAAVEWALKGQSAER